MHHCSSICKLSSIRIDCQFEIEYSGWFNHLIYIFFLGSALELDVWVWNKFEMCGFSADK